MTVNVYPRAFSIHIDNPLDGIPSCTFQQERVAEINGEFIKQSIGELRVAYDPNNETMLQVYTLLRRFYLELIGLEEPPAVEDPPVDTFPEPDPPPGGEVP